MKNLKRLLIGTVLTLALITAAAKFNKQVASIDPPLPIPVYGAMVVETDL